ncbi:RING-H2 finger protein ATL18-like [Cornus florida]|uniref:RING-H2 finger protein ATL18-like n=1 Tax=Cornus florida TaxID=4283 RepID=UPI00289D03FA|nr:RING-H2 finger protein ATL18-like [Cornus florida]
MICLAYSGGSMSNVALIFYTCLWIPFLQIKLAVLGIVGFVLYPFSERSRIVQQNGCCCVPVARFEDVKKCMSGGKGGKEEEDVVCSICLVEYEKEDVVSQLPKCGHLFHMACIERWLDRNHFTCPLCRSLFFAC